MYYDDHGISSEFVLLYILSYSLEQDVFVNDSHGWR